MYLEYFSLKEFPFRLTPDTDFLYMSEAHVRAKAYMDYTIWNRDGFVVITGEVGSGKTTLLQKLLSEIDENVIAAKIFQTQLDEVEFLQSVLVEFGLNPFSAKKVEIIDMLNTFLIEQFMQNRQLVLIVDDAHNLSMKVLEEIRMLSGLETHKEKLLHVILVGQPQLNDVLEAPEMEQLLQRVRLRYHIKALSEADMRHYITHRLHVAGMVDKHLFEDDTFPEIYRYSGGLPRLINTLCDTCLICAYADSVPTITAGVLSTAIEELQWQPYAKRVSKQQARSGAGDRRDRELLHAQTRALINVGNQISRFDTVSPLLSTMAGKMANIESLLHEVVRALQGHVPDTSAKRKGAKPIK